MILYKDEGNNIIAKKQKNTYNKNLVNTAESSATHRPYEVTYP